MPEVKSPCDPTPGLYVYDNGGKTFDRYTLVCVGASGAAPGRWPALGLSDNCNDPDGFSQWSEVVVGPRLGKLIQLADLPKRVREHGWLRVRSMFMGEEDAQEEA